MEYNIRVYKPELKQEEGKINNLRGFATITFKVTLRFTYIQHNTRRMSDMSEKNNVTDKEKKEMSFENQENVEEVNLDDCNVPIGCPFGLDPAEDMFPNHH